MRLTNKFLMDKEIRNDNIPVIKANTNTHSTKVNAENNEGLGLSILYCFKSINLENLGRKSPTASS